MKQMRFALSRRSFLRQTGLSALAAPFLTRRLFAASPHERIRHASFGANGMAWADLSELSKNPSFELVAVAEVDLNRADQVRKRFPGARIYQDWRQMLDKEKELDSVNVSTPDHMHAPMAMSALQLATTSTGRNH